MRHWYRHWYGDTGIGPTSQTLALYPANTGPVSGEASAETNRLWPQSYNVAFLPLWITLLQRHNSWILCTMSKKHCPNSYYIFGQQNYVFLSYSPLISHSSSVVKSQSLNAPPPRTMARILTFAGI